MNRRPSPGLARRVAAMVYDTFLLAPLIMLAVAVAMAARAGFTALSGGAIEASQLRPGLVQVLAVLTTIGFYTGFWRLNGQTLGMQAWGIKIESVEAGELSISQCLRRCLFAAVSLLPLGLGYWWCLFDKQGRCWHDRWSKTRLCLLPGKGSR